MCSPGLSAQHSVVVSLASDKPYYCVAAAFGLIAVGGDDNVLIHRESDGALVTSLRDAAAVHTMVNSVGFFTHQGLPHLLVCQNSDQDAVLGAPVHVRLPIR